MKISNDHGRFVLFSPGGCWYLHSQKHHVHLSLIKQLKAKRLSKKEDNLVAIM